MSLFLLDTDHLSLFQRGHPVLKSRLDHTTLSRTAITIITAEELIRGRFAQIRSAITEANQLRAYRWLRETLELINDFSPVDYDANAYSIYESLRRQRIRIGTQDLRIAAIALSVGATLVTRNRADFGQVPGLAIQDWTV